MVTITLSLIDENPFRDFELDPIDPKMVESIRANLNLPLLRGIALRPSPITQGRFELACGHHRIEAMVQEGLTEYDLTPESYTDQEMIDLMTDENNQRTEKRTLGARNNSVAATARQIIRTALDAPHKNMGGSANDLQLVRTLRQEDIPSILTNGPGEDLLFHWINDFGRAEHVDKPTRMKITVIREAMESLRTGGVIATILVQERERYDLIMRQRAEAERQRLAAIEAARVAREAEAERKRLEEIERARRAEQAAAEAVERERLRLIREAVERQAAEERRIAEVQRLATEAATQAADAAERKRQQEEQARIAEERRKAEEAAKLYNPRTDAKFELPAHAAAFRKTITHPDYRRLIRLEEHDAIADDIIALLGNKITSQGIADAIQQIVSDRDAQHAQRIQQDRDRAELIDMARVATDLEKRLAAILTRGLTPEPAQAEILRKLGEQIGVLIHDTTSQANVRRIQDVA